MAVPLVALDAILTALLALALALLIVAILRSLSKILGGIPGVGGWIAGKVDAMAQAITNALGAAFHGLDKLIGAAWHAMARYADQLWHQLEFTAHTLAVFGQILGNQLYSVTGLRSLVHRLEKVWHGIEHGVRDLTKAEHKLAHKVHVLEQEISKGIGEDVLPRVKTLEREITHVENKVIPDIRAGINTAETDISELAKYIADNFVTDAQLATEATAAAILAVAGLSWLRCNSNPFMNNRNACGLWGDLANLLALAVISAATLASIYELIAIAQKVTPTITQIASEALSV